MRRLHDEDLFTIRAAPAWEDTVQDFVAVFDAINRHIRTINDRLARLERRSTANAVLMADYVKRIGELERRLADD